MQRKYTQIAQQQFLELKNAEDIYAEAQQINEDRAAAETEEFEDVEEVSEETTDVEEDTAE